MTQGILLETSCEISASLGIPHKKVKEIIKKHGIGSEPGGLKTVDGKRQRIVIVNRYELEEKMSSNFTSLKRTKSKKKEK